MTSAQLSDFTRCGLRGIEHVPFGIHACHFYGDRDQLVAALVPYFIAGLRENERCLWVTAPPLAAREAIALLRAAYDGIDDAIQAGALRILETDQWYGSSGQLKGIDAVQFWLAEEERALADGYKGLRITGNTNFLRPGDWQSFMEYEQALTRSFSGRRIVALCSYALAQCHDQRMSEVMHAHQCAFKHSDVEWQVSTVAGAHKSTEGSGPETHADLRLLLDSAAENLTEVHPRNSGLREMQSWCPSGLQTVPHLQWGSHLAHFFGSGTELRDVLVPYFKAGLENNQRCLWVAGQAFNAEQARAALRAAVPDLDKRERDKQIEIANGEEWYATGKKLRPHELVSGLMQREQDALGFGYEGLRTNGNCAWVSQDQWTDFLEYERLVQKAVSGRRMICMCSYCMGQLRDHSYRGHSHIEIMERHHLVVPSALPSLPGQRGLNGKVVGLTNTVQEVANEHQLRQTLERQKRTFDLAMTAAQMGTWRYTLADNICVYDENAQRLYGLTEARFLHNEEGVKSKFHPDDLELMWSRVAKALDPGSDGRYDVEYRVKQLDGSWRWLSAWGLVEFEDDGPQKAPVAIAGASRDITERKQAEELQRLLLNELNHRVKNTLATIQAITALTLRGARDLPSAREALDCRIRSMAQAHDLLTLRAWTSANLKEVVTRALDPFTPAQVEMSGAAIDISSKHALALSLALHELATNAAKYGALSCPEGRVSVRWGVLEGMLHIDWEESGGPRVAPPTKKGFGSRLLEEIVGLDLGGDTKLDYDVAGVRCRITAKL